MTDRDISRIWWRLCVPLALLVFAATLPSKWAAEPSQNQLRSVIVTHPDGSLRLDRAVTREVDAATRNLLPLQRRESVPFLANLGRNVALPIAAIADEVTTHQGLARGCKEVGALKNTAVRIVVKVLVVIANWALVEYGDGSTDWIPWVAAVAWGGVAYHNSKVKC